MPVSKDRQSHPKKNGHLRALLAPTFTSRTEGDIHSGSRGLGSYKRMEKGELQEPNTSRAH